MHMNMKTMLCTWSLIVSLLLAFVVRTAGQSPPRQTPPATGKPRVVITQDPELDDVNTVKVHDPGYPDASGGEITDQVGERRVRR